MSSSHSEQAEEETGAASLPSVEEQMQAVLELVDARAAGRATNAQVEAAVARLLELQAAVAPPTAGAAAATTVERKDPDAAAAEVPQTEKAPPPPAPAPPPPQQEIQPDTENYDDDDEDEEEETIAAKQQPARGATKKTASAKQGKQKKTRRKSKKTAADETIPTADWSVYESIPLGKQGAQMMTTFGDGRAPRPAAVAAALQGARLWLQTAIRDARTLRRRQRQVYRAAKDSLKADRPQKPALQSEWSNEILYRAGAGYDQLAYDPKCGFRTEDLRQLFPEAMNAYERWNQMHAETAEANSKGDDDDNDDNNKEEDEEAESKTTATSPIKGISSEEGGHLQERAAQFDLRTEKMQEAWYLKYAALRQGSFLPRSRASSNPSDADWDRARHEHKQQSSGGGGGFGTGRPKNNSSSATNNSGSWAHMPAPTVRFLHWVGFEPQSVLPPPTDETTHALAFLGYDFFGRIVEKAILLRKNAQRGTTRTTTVQTNKDDDDEDEAAVLLLELEEGEQLEEDDIARAMDDPEIKPVPLYSADSSKNKKAGTMTQLYFGPGFENRLEMELEEMLASSSSATAGGGVSEEEMKIRQQEEAVFARLAAPPARDAIAVALDAQQPHLDKRNTPNKNKRETSARTTKRGRPKKRHKS